jgi:hypothetical protein
MFASECRHLSERDPVRHIYSSPGAESGQPKAEREDRAPQAPRRGAERQNSVKRRCAPPCRDMDGEARNLDNC